MRVDFYIQSKTPGTKIKWEMGLSRKKQFIIFRNIKNQQTEKMRQKRITIFKNIDFKVEITTKLSKVHILDITFDLQKMVSDRRKRK